MTVTFVFVGVCLVAALVVLAVVAATINGKLDEQESGDE